MNWQDILQFILNLLNKPTVTVPVQNQTLIKVQRLISNTNGQFDIIQVLTNSVLVWSGVAGENNILPNCPIQAGKYHLQWYNSPAEGYQDLILVDVPQHSFIEMHIGNFPNHDPNHGDESGDSKGCLLIAESFDNQSNPTMVCNSKEGFNAFKNSLPQDLSNVTLEIS